MSAPVDPTEDSRDGRAVRALLITEWTNPGQVYACPSGFCSSWQFKQVHSPDCPHDKALTEFGYPTRQSRDAALTKMRDAEFNKRWNIKK